MGINIQGKIGSSLSRLLPNRTLKALVREVSRQDPEMILQEFGPVLNREPNLERMVFDLSAKAPLQFENLSGLFASTSFDHAVVLMTIRQSAYIFGLIRGLQPKKIIEIGRYKGGSTFLMASAMPADCELWSIDLGEKEARLREVGSSYDQQLTAMCRRFNFKVHLLVGDSRTIQLDVSDVDVAFIDGDHSYEGAKIDFERFGKRVRIGGAVLFDDAFEEGLFKTHSDTVGRLVREIDSVGDFKLVKSVNRLAHLERIR